MSSHPKDASKELIDAIYECEKVGKHLHLPVQSGNDDVLNRMNRKYTAQKYLEIISYAREKMPDFSFSSDAWYDNFKELETKIRDFLINKGLVECPDVKKDILYMFDAAEELKSLENIVEWINGGEKENTQISFSEVSADNIDTLIQHFEKKVNEPSADFSERREFEKEFSDFFEKLRDADDLTLTEDQTKRLHQIVSKIVEQFPVSGIWYRRIILKIPVRSN